MGFRGILLLIFFYQISFTSAQKLVLKTSPPSPVYAAENTNLIVNCTVEESELIALQWASSKNNEVYRITSNRRVNSLVFQRLNYSNEGVYYCRAFNQTSGLLLAQTNITVIIGNPPPKPPSPTLKRVCGYPPTELIVSYQYTYTSLTSTYYPVTVELLVSPITMRNPCVTPSNDFKVVEKSRQIIHRPKNVSFKVNVAEVYMKMIPDFPNCSDENNPFDCTLLCTYVRTTNAFGARWSDTLLKQLEKNCGEVADFRAIKVGRNSISVAWGLPRCLRNSTQIYYNLYYWIWCEPSCGEIKISSNVNIISGLNYTINSLMEYTNYTLFASSSFFPDPLDAGKHVSYSVQTKEGVPKVTPTIEGIRWLSDSTCSNGTALVSWKVKNGKDALRGKVRYFIVAYREVNSSSTIKRNVSVGVHQLVVSELQMDKSYEFTTTVCTGGGCGKASSYYGLSSDDCKSSNSPPDRLNFYSKTWIWIGIGSILVLLLITVGCAYAIFKQKRSGRVDLPPPLPTDGICPTNVFPPSQPDDPIDDNYAYAYDTQVPPQSGPEFLANRPQELRTSTICLSRSSSVLTCSTEI